MQNSHCLLGLVYLVLFSQPICRGTSLRLLDSGTQAVIEVVLVDFNIIWGGSLTVWFIGIARILIQSGLEVEEGSKSISFLFTTALCIKHWNVRGKNNSRVINFGIDFLPNFHRKTYFFVGSPLRTNQTKLRFGQEFKARTWGLRFKIS